MKKMITTSVIVAALLTSAQAGFSFGDMFDDMKDVATAMTEDAKDSQGEYAAESKILSGLNWLFFKDAVEFAQDEEDSSKNKLPEIINLSNEGGKRRFYPFRKFN